MIGLNRYSNWQLLRAYVNVCDVFNALISFLSNNFGPSYKALQKLIHVLFLIKICAELIDLLWLTNKFTSANKHAFNRDEIYIEKEDWNI